VGENGQTGGVLAVIFAQLRQSWFIGPGETRRVFDMVGCEAYGVMFAGIKPDELLAVEIKMRGLVVFDVRKGFDIETGEDVSAGRLLQSVAGLRGVQASGGPCGVFFQDDGGHIGHSMKALRIDPNHYPRLALELAPRDKGYLLDLVYLAPFKGRA
jgi:hypothetical protein